MKIIISIVLSFYIGFALPYIHFMFITGLNPTLGYAAIFIFLLLPLVLNLRLVFSIPQLSSKLLLLTLVIASIAIAICIEKIQLNNYMKENPPRRLYDITK